MLATSVRPLMPLMPLMPQRPVGAQVAGGLDGKTTIQFAGIAPVGHGDEADV